MQGGHREAGRLSFFEEKQVMTEYVARIRPDAPCQVRVVGGVVFEAKKGWYTVAEGLVPQLMQETVHGLRTASIPVFDVLTRDAAAVEDERARRKVEPAGTAQAPVAPAVMSSAMRIPGAPVVEEREVEAPAKRRVRRTVK